MKLSHSKLSCILTCPMSYYLGYELGMYKKVEKTALAIGSAVHWGIEHDTEDLSDYYKEQGSFKQGDNYTRDQLLAEAMCHGYLKHKEELMDKLLTNPRTGKKLECLEETHEIYLTGKLNSKLRKDELIHDFVGIIDLLLLTEDGFILVDYKTSSQYPDWDNYLEQLYRYIFILRCNFPDVPVLKIAIINLRKTGIRQKKGETEFEFLQRMKFEYDINDESYVNYHEYLPEELNSTLIDDYISNLEKMADMAQLIVDNKAWFINYGAARNQYGKSDWWDIFYRTPGAEVLYGIRDKVWDEDEQCFKDFRDCIALDMKVIDYFDKVLNKYSKFKQELIDTTCMTKEEFFSELSENYVVDINLLETYWTTFVKEKEVEENASKQQQSDESANVAQT